MKNKTYFNIEIYGIIRCFGKISANFRCVPWIDQGTDVKETDHYDFIHFRGFAIKIKTILKAITLSGLATTVINTFILMGKYAPCPGYEDAVTTIIIAWIISFVIYVWVWRVDICYSVAEVNLFKKLVWFIGEKMIILVCGASFVRVIYI
eukprot:20120_1